jgi:hypothetical protein
MEFMYTDILHYLGKILHESIVTVEVWLSHSFPLLNKLLSKILVNRINFLWDPEAELHLKKCIFSIYGQEKWFFKFIYLHVHTLFVSFLPPDPCPQKNDF